MHTGPVGRWPGVIMARCCMPRRGAAAGVLLILCSVAAPGWNPALTFIRLRRRKNSLARHGRGAEQAAPRLVRAAEFRSRGGDDSLRARPPIMSTLRTDGGPGLKSGGKGTAITLQVYCDAPALETRTPTASQRHLLEADPTATIRGRAALRPHPPHAESTNLERWSSPPSGTHRAERKKRR